MNKWLLNSIGVALLAVLGIVGWRRGALASWPRASKYPILYKLHINWI